MWIFSKPFEALGESDLASLLETPAAEGISLEFKREMYGRSSGDIKEMLRDIASIANAEGGVLIIGLAEDATGRATGWFNVPNANVEATRLTQSANDAIADRILGLRARSVAVSGGDAIVVQIPRSFRRPHMVTYDGATDFWMRRDRQKGRMSVAEIRSAVTTTEDAMTKVERFIRERHRALRRVMEVTSEPVLTLTATPLLLEEQRVDLDAQGIRELVTSPPKYGSRPAGQLTGTYPNVMPTLHGIRNGLTSVKRVEVFRTGHLEFASREQLFFQMGGKGKKFISTGFVAKPIRNFVHFAMRLREISQISDPYLFGLKFWRTAGLEMSMGLEGATADGDSRGYHEEEHLTVPPILSSSDDAADAVTRQIVDRFWNAFGYAKCPYFDKNGGFVLPPAL